MWTVLRGHADWERYQQAVAAQSGYVGTPINWGGGPKEYPCLVSTYLPPPRPGEQPRLVSAYVYESDAQALLKAAPRHPEAGGVQPPGQANTNRWHTAHDLVWAKIAREVCCVKPEQFEEWLLEALELYDQARGEKRAEIMAKLDPMQRSIIDRLDPPG
jgi:hypothetical protein